MTDRERDWIVLFIGGASGVGKSCVAYELARFYNINVLEVDDVFLAVKTMTSKENLPAVHYWDSGLNWIELGVKANVDWLNGVSSEIAPSLKAVAENHIESNVPVIIEGDFISPELTASFNNPKVKSVFIIESDANQIAKNYFAREGGDLQRFRADVSAEYGTRLSEKCLELGINVIESRPWETVLNRIIKTLI